MKGEERGDTAPSRRWRPIQLAAGIVVTLVSFAFLVRYGYVHRGDMRAVAGADFAVPWAVAAAAIYAAALVATAAGWVFATRAFGEGLVWPKLAATALLGQIGKYAPGNVAQHVGRITLAKGQGVTIALAAKATALELPSAVLAGALVAALAAATRPAALSGSLSGLLGLFTVGLAVAGVVGLAVVREAMRRNQRLTRSALAMFATHFVSAALAAASFYAMSRAMVGRTVSPTDCAFAFSLAWLAGFATPGAPAGLGIREAVLVLALPQLGPAALVVALGHRLATAAADAAMALVGAALLAPGTRGLWSGRRGVTR